MSEHDVPTIQPLRVPVALVVGADTRCLGIVSAAALSAQVLVVDCHPTDASTVAAEMRPLVLVLPREVFDDDRDGYEALARDLRSAVLVVDAASDDAATLEARLLERMNAAESRRSSWAGDPR